VQQWWSGKCFALPQCHPQAAADGIRAASLGGQPLLGETVRRHCHGNKQVCRIDGKLPHCLCFRGCTFQGAPAAGVKSFAVQAAVIQVEWHGMGCSSFVFTCQYRLQATLQRGEQSFIIHARLSQQFQRVGFRVVHECQRQVPVADLFRLVRVCQFQRTLQDGTEMAGTGSPLQAEWFHRLAAFGLASQGPHQSIPQAVGAFSQHFQCLAECRAGADERHQEMGGAQEN